MSFISSKLQVEEYLRNHTKHLNLNELSACTTIRICKSLNMSRSLVSHYLNELVKENKAIKISSRPVYYFDRTEMERKYHVSLNESDYVSMAELLKELKESDCAKKDFQKAIGYDGSLNDCICQITSALLYPGGGLPILLFGEKGCGKSYLAKLVYEFCINHALLKNVTKLYEKKVFKAIAMQNHMEELFGVYDEANGIDKKGLIEEANGGVLYIKGLENLSEDCQEKLAEYISSGHFTRMQDEQVYRESDARIICSIEEPPQEALAQGLLLNLPITCYVPNYLERSEEEREQFIIHFFQTEQDRLDKTIYVSKKLLTFLMEYSFEHNINELNKCIKTICANAYADCAEQQMYIYQYHLPGTMLRQLTISGDKEDDCILLLDGIETGNKNNRIVNMWEELLWIYVEYRHSLNLFLENGQKTLRRYYDLLFFQETYSDVRLKAIEKIVIEILNHVKNARNINLPINCGYVLTRMIMASRKNDSIFHQWEADNRKEIRSCLKMMADSMQDVYILADVIVRQIYANLNFKFNEMNMIFLMLNICFYNRDIRSQDTIGVILSHGYSTASSIADAANTLLSTYIFEAIDMPLNTPVQEIGKKLNDFIEENRHLKNIILLVDMGSLEEMGEVIADSVNVGVINNISTSLALNIGSKILQYYELEEILKSACEENQCHYKVLSVAKKEKVIVFTNDAGMVVSKKLSRLFKESLPRSIDLKMIEYDYEELVRNGNDDILFQKYDVVLMIKPYQLKLKKIRCVTLEEIVNFKDIGKVNHVLSPYLDRKEIEEFDAKLLKNFSMQSVMENLTILNAQKLLDYVSDAVKTLQHMMGRTFQSKTIVGIYIHVCFLIERLVTKTAIEKYENLDHFVREQKEFIQFVNQSFETMLSHYNVKIPISEIACLYEYIEHDERKGEETDEF